MQSDRYSDLRLAHVDHSEMVSDEYDLPEGWTLAVEDGSEVAAGDIIAYLGEKTTITAQHAGRARLENNKVIVSYENHQEAEYEIPTTSRLLVKDGDHVEAGQPLTEGSLNPHRILRIQGRQAARCTC